MSTCTVLQCHRCNKEFEPSGRKGQRYCSRHCQQLDGIKRYRDARKPKPAPNVPALSLIPKPVSPPASLREQRIIDRWDARRARELDLTAPAPYRAPSLAAAEAITQSRNYAVNRSECLTGAAGATRHAVGGMINATC